MRKILVLLFAFLVFSLPYQQTYLEVEAAVASKAATLTAKKMMKEVIQDVAVEQASTYAVFEAIDIINNYQSKEGFKTVCPSGGTTCDKPIQIKETLTDSDKTAIKGQAGTELDNLLNNGKGLTRWQKILDWFIPVWLVAFGTAAITYTANPDFQSLVDEAAYNALVALGFIIPAESYTVDKPITEIGKDLDTIENTPVQPSDGRISNTWTNLSQGSFNYGWSVPNTPMTDTTAFEVAYTRQSPSSVTIGLPASVKTHSSTFPQPTLYKKVGSNATFHIAQSTYGVNEPQLLIQINNGTTLSKNNGFTMTKDGTYNYLVEISNPDVNIMTEQARSVLHRMPYEINGFWFTDILYKTVDGNSIAFQIKTDTKPRYGGTDNIHTVYSSIDQTGTITGVRYTLHTKLDLMKKELFPTYDDIALDGIPDTTSKYEDENGNIALLPPAAFTYQEEATGEQVERKANANGDGYTWQKPDGTEVPEENVIPKPEEEPKITTSPEGVPQYTPAPTPSNPEPTPEPLTPTQPAPEPAPEDGGTSPPPASTEEPPLEPFPEGESCQAKLQFPIFSPLKEQLSTSFPFSIPWDIGRAIEAGFGGISDEKPSFNLDLKVMNETKTIEITTPTLFDKWKPFTDSFLIFVFDVSIMFGIYRFVKGAGS